MKICTPINPLLIAVLLIGATAVLSGCSYAKQKDKGSRINSSLEKDDYLKRKLAELVQYRVPDKTDRTFEINDPEKREGYTISRISISGKETETIPGYLLLPANTKPPYPVMICLQGHSPGMHISIGDARTSRDSVSIQGGRDLALQAIQNGWAAMVIELKGFGERAEENLSCNDLSLRELMQGTPMLGHRTTDVSLAIDFIESQPLLDAKRIACMGNSSGGTTAYFASCLDERISLAVVSCSFATYGSSWLKHPHCACGYIPGIMKVGDMPDFAGLIAPRKLIIIAGQKDPIADIEGVRAGVEIARKSFKEKQVSENLVFLEGIEGHKFYPELAWPEINKSRSLTAE